MSMKYADRDFKKNPLTRKDVQTHFIDENGERLQTSTKQSDRDKCDVNAIIARAKKGHVITHVRDTPGRYQDVTSVGDFRESMNKVVAAQAAFEALPAALRKRFHNDPEEFLGFVADNGNYDEAVKLGLVEPKEEPKPFVAGDAPNPDTGSEGA